MLVFVQNDPRVPPGIFAEFLKEWAVPFVIFHPYGGETLPDPSRLTAVVVLGGYMSVGETERYPFLLDVKDFIRQVVQSRVPCLGICLGGQLLAEFFGARVLSNCRSEHGCHEVELTPEGSADPLFQSLPKTFSTFQWHNDSFDLPAGAVPLAASSKCTYQAFRFGDNTYGLQFHPEVDKIIVHGWCLDSGAGGEEAMRIFCGRELQIRRMSGQLLRNFLGILPIAVF
jgi:GMP synthase-like glutamine amidotransferase